MTASTEIEIPSEHLSAYPSLIEFVERSKPEVVPRRLKSVLKKRSSWNEEKLNIVVKKQKTSNNSWLDDDDAVDRLQEVSERKRKNASHLWVSGQMSEAVAEMCRAEAISAKLCPSLRSRAIRQSLITQEDNHRVAPSTGRRVAFEETPLIIGIADADVDRQPIDVTAPTKIERLLIRAARILPSCFC